MYRLTCSLDFSHLSPRPPLPRKGSCSGRGCGHGSAPPTHPCGPLALWRQTESGLSGGVTAGCESGGPCRGGHEKGPRAQHLPSCYQGPRKDVRSSQTVLLCLPLHQGTCPHQGASPSSPGLPSRTFQVKPIDCTGKSAFACATLRLPVPVSSLGGGAPPWAHASRARTPAKVKVPHYEFWVFFF